MEYADNLYINGELLQGDIVIPDGTEKIGAYAFDGCSGLTSITIPDSVTSIGGYALNGVTAEIKWGDNPQITSIGNSVFIGYKGSNITIPDSVTSIGDYAFYDCSGLTSITIPDSVTSIGSSAFWGCSGLSSITIGNGVISIGGCAFSGCSGLTSVTIPDSVTSIGGNAFDGCSGLTSITVPFVGKKAEGNGETHFGYIFGASYSLDNGDYVPDSLKEVIITGGTSIGYAAFEGCSGLTSITIPDSVTSIGSNAFNGCSGLTSVTIPDSVTSIGYNAFRGCSGLTSITIPFVGKKADGSGETHFGYIFGASYSLDNGDYVPDSLKEVIITGGASIYGYAFRGCSGLTSITIPDSVTSIGDYAFSGCSGLTSITIPDSVTSIGSYAFENCSGLSRVIFEKPNGWWRSSIDMATSGTSISSSDLADPSTAATYLKSTYTQFYWKRG